jgi:hypothetical protein
MPALPKMLRSSSSSSGDVMSGRQELVHLVVEEVALLLADVE